MNRTWAFRPILRPECIEAILREVGSFDDSLKQGTVCAACYVFCQSALRQHEDTRSDEVIISELKSCVEQLKGKMMHSCNEEVVDEVALLKTCLYLGGIMLNDQAITFPCLYQHNCKASVTPVHLPQYCVLVYVGREFGNLLSMICRHDKIGRMLFRTNSDPFTMLSHAVVMKPMARKVHDTALYLNEKVHTLSKLLIEQRKKDQVGACMFSLELFSSIVDPDLLSFLRV